MENQDLVLALKGASQEVANKIFNNMSKRASDMLREDIQFWDRSGCVMLRNHSSELLT